MFEDTTLIINIINAACILFLILMLITLAAATRMRGGAGWAALIVTVAIVPASLSNLTRDLAMDCFVWFMYPRVFLSLFWFPGLWFFTKSQLDHSFRLSIRHLWHTIPAFIALVYTIVYYAPLSAEQIEAERIILVSGKENMPVLMQDIFGMTQFLCYFTAMFFYVRKQKKYIHNNYSHSGLTNIRWLVNFLIVHFVLFLSVMIIYALYPRTDSWLCPIATVLGMFYLIYVVIYHSPAPYLSHLPNGDAPATPLPAMTTAQMKEICDTVVQYLQTSHAYKNGNLTLAVLSKETGIPQKNISTAINTYLKKNFFELVNAMRIEEAKRLLQSINTSHKIESIVTECGFHSRSTFFSTFKKMEGTSPTQWLKNVQN